MAIESDARAPVNVLTGFLGSGKTTLLQRLLRSPRLARTAVLINEFGEVGLDHLLVTKVDESVVLLASGCICCSVREDLEGALLDLLGRRERAEIPAFDRVIIETTGLADPGPILFTLLGAPVIRHHYRLGNVITTVDVVNASLQLERTAEGVKQVAAADRLVLTKSDLASPGQMAGVRDELARLNPAALVCDTAAQPLDVDFLLDDATSVRGQTGARYLPREDCLHDDAVSSFSLVLDRPADWTAFGLWLSLLLHRHGEDVLRVKGILRIEGRATPVFVNAVQHVMHPPQHLATWPTGDHRSRIVFITRGIEAGRLRRSLEAFCRLRANAPSEA